MVTIIFMPSLLLFFTGFFTAVFTRGGMVPWRKTHVRLKEGVFNVVPRTLLLIIFFFTSVKQDYDYRFLSFMSIHLTQPNQWGNISTLRNEMKRLLVFLEFSPQFPLWLFFILNREWPDYKTDHKTGWISRSSREHCLTSANNCSRLSFVYNAQLTKAALKRDELIFLVWVQKHSAVFPGVKHGAGLRAGPLRGNPAP